MKKKQSHRERRIKKVARMTAKFFNQYGRLPYGLTYALVDVRVSELIIFNLELGKWSREALNLLLHDGEIPEGYDASGPDDNHPGLTRTDGTMFQ
jgi:hypothetical protein